MKVKYVSKTDGDQISILKKTGLENMVYIFSHMYFLTFHYSASPHGALIRSLELKIYASVRLLPGEVKKKKVCILRAHFQKEYSEGAGSSVFG